MSAAPVIPDVTAAAFANALRRAASTEPLILDVRDVADTAAWPVPAPPDRLLAVPLPALDDAAVTRVGVRAGGRAVHVLCARGNRSQTATERLRRAGIDAVSVRGGMAAWSRLLTVDVALVAGGVVVVQLRREARGCLGYLLVAGDEALSVDPTGDWEEHTRQAERHGARIVSVMDTHVHADHVSAVRQLAAATGAQLLLAQQARARGSQVPDATLLSDGQRLALGPIELKVVALPGHTTDMTGLLLPGDAGLVGGDSLFTEAVARPDLQAGDAGAPEAAATLHATLHRTVLRLGDACVLLPGHYPGGRMTRPVRATIGELRARLAVLALDERAFVSRVLADMPSRPANHEAIIASNLAGDDADADRLEIGANSCAAAR